MTGRCVSFGLDTASLEDKRTRLRVFMETSSNHKNGVGVARRYMFRGRPTYWWTRVVMSECGRKKYAGNELGGAQ